MASNPQNIEDLTNRIAHLSPAKQAAVGGFVAKLESVPTQPKMTLDEVIDQFEREHPELLHLLAQ